MKFRIKFTNNKFKKVVGAGISKLKSGLSKLKKANKLVGNNKIVNQINRDINKLNKWNNYDVNKAKQDFANANRFLRDRQTKQFQDALKNMPSLEQYYKKGGTPTREQLELEAAKARFEYAKKAIDYLQSRQKAYDKLKMDVVGRMKSYGATGHKINDNYIDFNVGKARKTAVHDAIKSGDYFDFDDLGDFSSPNIDLHYGYDTIYNIIQNMGGDFVDAYAKYQEILDYKAELYGVDFETLLEYWNYIASRN